MRTALGLGWGQGGRQVNELERRREELLERARAYVHAGSTISLTLLETAAVRYTYALRAHNQREAAKQ